MLKSQEWKGQDYNLCLWAYLYVLSSKKVKNQEMDRFLVLIWMGLKSHKNTQSHKKLPAMMESLWSKMIFSYIYYCVSNLLKNKS